MTERKGTEAGPTSLPSVQSVPPLHPAAPLRNQVINKRKWRGEVPFTVPVHITPRPSPGAPGATSRTGDVRGTYLWARLKTDSGTLGEGGRASVSVRTLALPLRGAGP